MKIGTQNMYLGILLMAEMQTIFLKETKQST